MCRLIQVEQKCKKRKLFIAQGRYQEVLHRPRIEMEAQTTISADNGCRDNMLGEISDKGKKNGNSSQALEKQKGGQSKKERSHKRELRKLFTGQERFFKEDGMLKKNKRNND